MGSPKPVLSLSKGSRVVLLNACPVLRPRWRPDHLPCRFQGCCLPLVAVRRLSSLLRQELSHWTTMQKISRLHSAAYILDSPSSVLPLPGLHVGFTTALLARL